MKSPIISVRFSPSEVEALEAIASRRNCSRSEAARIAINYGLPLANAGHSFNVTRTVLLLEYMQAAIDVIITRDHGDVVGELLEAAKQRLAIYHA